MEAKKIALFSWESLHSERIGGLSNATTYLAEELAKTNEVHFFTRGNRDFTYLGVHYHAVRPHGGNIIEYCHNMSHELVARFREFDSPSFDIIHFHDWHVTEALHLLQDRNTVFTYHSTEYGRNGNQHGDWWEAREISGKEWYAGLIAKQVTTVSHVLREEIKRIYNVPDWKIQVFPNGVIPEQFDVLLDQGEVKKQIGIHPYAPTILFTGRMATQKGPDMLLDAVKDVQSDNWGVEVIMAGDGGMRPWLENIARERHLPIRFPGFVSDSQYIRFLHAADLVVIPSRNEPFGIVLPEAWSAGKGVVACDVGGLRENIESYHDGIKVSPSASDISRGICEALADPAKLHRYGRTGQAKAYREFNWSRIAEKIDIMYTGIGA